MIKIAVINGPSLCLLGKRNTDVYGTKTLDEICDEIKAEAEMRGVFATFFVSNHEGDLIDEIHRCALGGYDAVLLNAGALTHYSYALRDAIEAASDIGTPTWEVHLSDISSREDFRKISVIREVCAGCIYGLGDKSYIAAMNEALIYIKNTKRKTDLI